jgi:hypothetical protein
MRSIVESSRTTRSSGEISKRARRGSGKKSKRARRGSGQEIAASAAGLRQEVTASAAGLRQDFEAIAARLLKAQQESFRSQFGVLDDKYRDLPERVATLEDHAGITR